MLRGGKLYIIWNDINDKVYVGITSRRLSRRFHEHVYASLNHKDKFQFHSAIRKYGEEHFHMECLLDDVPIERLPLFEKACIEHFDSYKNGYNSTPGGDGTGKEVTEEFRQKMSKFTKGKLRGIKGFRCRNISRRSYLLLMLVRNILRKLVGRCQKPEKVESLFLEESILRKHG